MNEQMEQYFPIFRKIFISLSDWNWTNNNNGIFHCISLFRYKVLQVCVLVHSNKITVAAWVWYCVLKHITPFFNLIDVFLDVDFRPEKHFCRLHLVFKLFDFEFRVIFKLFDFEFRIIFKLFDFEKTWVVSYITHILHMFDHRS